MLTNEGIAWTANKERSHQIHIYCAVMSSRTHKRDKSFFDEVNESGDLVGLGHRGIE